MSPILQTLRSYISIISRGERRAEKQSWRWKSTLFTSVARVTLLLTVRVLLGTTGRIIGRVRRLRGVIGTHHRCRGHHQITKHVAHGAVIRRRHVATIEHSWSSLRCHGRTHVGITVVRVRWHPAHGWWLRETDIAIRLVSSRRCRARLHLRHSYLCLVLRRSCWLLTLILYSCCIALSGRCTSNLTFGWFGLDRLVIER